MTGEEIPYSLKSCAGKVPRSGRRAHNLIVKSIDGTSILDLPAVVECNEIPDDRSEIPTPEVAEHFPLLRPIANKIPLLDPEADIQLLIGRDVIEAHHVFDQLTKPKQTPFAQRLGLGWVIVGEVY